VSTGSLRALVRALGPLLALAAVWLFFALAAGEIFPGWRTLRLMLRQAAVVGTAGGGATVLSGAGGIDLSVGSPIALGPVVVPLL
jgi:ribose/xylose/arabinose/galactoside ABC-type transport system permease subunit